MSKTPFYKTGISSSPFNNHKKGHVDVKSGEFDKSIITKDTHNAAQKNLGQFSPTHSGNVHSPVSIKANGKVYTGQEFRDLKSNQLKSMNVQSYTDHKGNKQKLSGSFNTPELLRSFKSSQIKSKMHDTKVDTNKRFQNYVVDSIESGDREYTHIQKT